LYVKSTSSSDKARWSSQKAKAPPFGGVQFGEEEASPDPELDVVPDADSPDEESPLKTCCAKTIRRHHGSLGGLGRRLLW
jgi:hypothetical protein